MNSKRDGFARPGGVLAALLAGLVMFAATPERAAAQDSPMFGLGVAITYGFLGGDDFDLLDDALGFEALGSVAWPTGLELGAGVGFSSHDVDPGDADADLTTVFGEGRYRFNVPAAHVQHFHPYVAGRVGYANRGEVPAGAQLGPSVSGLFFGFGGGVEYWLTESVGLEGGGLLNFLNLDNDVSGTKLDVRGGLKVRF